jgi:hypothetical protein
MKKAIKLSVLLLFFVGLTAMSAHRFYVGIYQVDFVPQKKRLEITTRIFMDDLNDALAKAYKKQTNIGDSKETPEDLTLMKKYLSDKFKIYLNGQLKTMNFRSHEQENNVIICYLTVKEVPKITKMEVENSILTELHNEQQNIIQFNNNGKKQNLLLSSSTTKGMLK